MDHSSTIRKYHLIAGFFFLLVLLFFFSCSTKEVIIAFGDIDDSFSFNGNTRIIIKLDDPHRSKHEGPARSEHSF